MTNKIGLEGPIDTYIALLRKANYGVEYILNSSDTEKLTKYALLLRQLDTAHHNLRNVIPIIPDISNFADSNFCLSNGILYGDTAAAATYADIATRDTSYGAQYFIGCYIKHCLAKVSGFIPYPEGYNPKTNDIGSKISSTNAPSSDVPTPRTPSPTSNRFSQLFSQVTTFHT